MSIKLTIIEQMEQIAREHGKILAPLQENLVLADCGLDRSALPFWSRVWKTGSASIRSRPRRRRSFR